MTRMISVALVLVVAEFGGASDTTKPVKVFILAGQSNMEGKAKVSVMDYQAQQPATRDLYKPFRNGQGWTERDDVWIRYHDHAGKLAVGYHKTKSIGPELAFGAVVGNHYQEQVLLIKTAWGGRSLYRDFRSPSAGLPPEAILEKMLDVMKKNKPNATLADVRKTFGATYRDMVSEVHGTLADLKKMFPAYAGQGYEIAGFVWFQGWNDMIDAAATAEYAVNMQAFIRDVRAEFKSPNLPFVIGQMGVDGLQAGKNVVRFKEAQAAVLKEPSFQGNVSLVKTDVFWDLEAEAIFKKGWRENLEAWNKVGSDFPYHYLGSPKTMLQIGRAFGEAVLALRGERVK